MSAGDGSGRTDLGAWWSILSAPLLYMALHWALRAAYGAAGFASETAGALGACTLCLPVALWCRRSGLRCSPPADFRMADGIDAAALALSLALVSAFLSLYMGGAEPGAVSPVLMLGQGICAPVCEELLYRGAVLQRSRALFRPWGAVLLSSVLFGAAHGGTWEMALAALAGVFFCLIRLGSGGLCAAVLAHVLVNLLSFWPGLCRLPAPFFLLGAAGLVIFPWRLTRRCLLREQNTDTKGE